MGKSRHASNAKVKEQQTLARNFAKGNPEIIKTVQAIKEEIANRQKINDKISDYVAYIKELTNWPAATIRQYLREDKMAAEPYANYMAALEDMRNVMGKQLDLNLVKDTRAAATGEGKRIDIVKKDARDEVNAEEQAS